MDTKTEKITVVRLATLNEAVQTFLDVGLAATSRQTRDWYAKRLAIFQRSLDKRDLSDLLEADLWHWYRELETRVYPATSVRGDPGPGPASAARISIYTQHGYIRALKRFFGWLYERQILSVDLSRDLKLPRLPKNGEKGVSDANALAILQAAKATPRDYALITFVESTGCRRGGASDLRLHDLNLDAPEPICRLATVREKGGTQREVPMSPRALEAMRAWVQLRDSSTDYVFVDTYPHRDDHFGLSPDGVSQIFKRYKTELGLKGPVSPHQWRHRLGRKLARSGMPLNQISQILGHKSVVVTSHFYGTFAMGVLQEAMDRYYRDPEED